MNDSSATVSPAACLYLGENDPCLTMKIVPFVLPRIIQNSFACPKPTNNQSKHIPYYRSKRGQNFSYTTDEGRNAAPGRKTKAGRICRDALSLIYGWTKLSFVLFFILSFKFRFLLCYNVRRLWQKVCAHQALSLSQHSF